VNPKFRNRSLPVAAPFRRRARWRVDHSIAENPVAVWNPEGSLLTVGIPWASIDENSLSPPGMHLLFRLVAVLLTY